MYLFRTLIMLATIGLPSCSCSKPGPSESAPVKAASIDLSRIHGEWHVLARIPTIIDRNATEMRVEFKPSSPRSMRLAWTFKKDTFSEQESSWNLKLALNPPSDSTSWDIEIFWPLVFRYQVIEYSGDYSWLVVGSADHKCVWILSRSKTMPPELLDGLLARLKLLDFKTASIVKQQAKSGN